MAGFPPFPCLTPSLKRNPSEFMDETYLAKTRGMVLPNGGNYKILSLTVFD